MESVECSREYVERKDKLQREGLGNPLPQWSGCSAGPVEDWGQVPVLTCRAKYVTHGPVYSGVGGTSSHCVHFTEMEQKLSDLRFILLQTQSFFQGHENCTLAAQENHFPPSSLHEMKAVTGRIILFVDLGTRGMVIVGQKWACFSDCSFSSLLALWDFLFVGKGTAASPVSVQRNCNCLNWEPYLNSGMKWKTIICFSISRCWQTN